MARSKDLKVNIVGDSDKLNKELRKSGGALDKFGKQTRLTGTVTSKGFAAMRVGAVGATAAIGGLALVGKKVVQAAMESEKSSARLASQLKALDISYSDHRDEIEKVIQKHSQLAGLDDEDLQDAFTGIVRTTGDVTKAMKSMGLVTDLARAKNIDVARAGELVAKIHAGNVGPLRRLGLEFTKTTDNVDKLKESNKNATPIQLRLAQSLDQSANSQKALALLTNTFRGQAEAYGKTTAGSVDRANVAFENLQETVGAALAPTVEDAATKVADFVNEMQDGTGQGGRFVDKLKEIWTETKPIVMWVGRAAKNVAEFVKEHPNVGKLAAAVLGVGVAVKTLRFASAATGFTDLLKLGRSTMRRLVGLFAAQGAAAGAASGTAAAGAEGIASKAGLLRRAGTRLGKALIAPFAAQGAAAGIAAGTAMAGGEGLTSAAMFNKSRTAGSRVGKVAGRGLVVGIIAGFAMLVPDLIKKLKSSIIGKPAKFGESIGKSLGNALGIGAGDGIGKVRIPNVMGGKAGNLMGASSALRPLAAVGSRFGLRVSSGLRPGAITSSGNVSYHGAGEAVDLAGPPAGMLRTFRALKSSVGGRLAELIYTPGGIGIKNGRPHRYTGKVAADHHDHVHVALDLGSPGPGIGRAGPNSRRGRTGDGEGKDVVGAFRRAIRKTKAPPKAALALFEAGIVESGLRNLTYGDRDSKGALQLRVSLHGEELALDPYRSALAFLTRGFTGAGGAIALSGRLKTAGQVAQAVQGSAFPKRYDQVRARALAYLGKAATASRGGSAGSGASAGERGESAGAAIANAIVAPFMRDTPGSRGLGWTKRGARAASPGIRSLLKGATSLGTQIEDAGTTYGQAERRFGQTDEDLGTAAGRTTRVSEIAALRDLKLKTLQRQEARAAALGKSIGKYTTMLAKLNHARKKAKGSTRAKLNERIKTYEERLDELKAELKALGFAIEDTKLDIGDLNKDEAEVRSTPDTGAEAQSAADVLSSTLGDIDAQERAGLLTPEQAKAGRISYLQRAKAGEFGALSQRELWDVMGQLRDIEQQVLQATVDNTSALRDVQKELALSNAIANSTVGIQLAQASRALGDLISGELGGRVHSRGTMPGSGSLSRL